MHTYTRTYTRMHARSAQLSPAVGSPSSAPRTLVSARMSKWPAGSDAPLVELRASLGQAGELEPETAAILQAEGIRCGKVKLRPRCWG
eukprot:355407-Chlamydomonas_euryale.AAC.4